MKENYNRYIESLYLDCECNKNKKQVKKVNDCSCGGINLPSHDNQIEILIMQLKREIRNLLKDTQTRLLCQDKKIAETSVYIKNNLSNYLRDLLDSMMQSGELDDLITETVLSDLQLLELKFEDVVNIKELGAKGDGVSDDSIPLQLAFNSEKIVIIPKGVYLTSKELTVKDNTTIIGESERESIIKAFGSNLTSVIRLSKSPVGDDTTVASNGIVIKNITVDADGIDYGIYTNYLTNESRLENITVINANNINICIGKSWFSKFTNLTAKNSKNVGFSIGIKQGNEGDYSVNGINFVNLRSHNNGTDETHDQNDNILRGAGFVIGGCQTCNFDMIQSEANYGIGVIFDSYFSNHFNSMYLENNSKNQTNRYSLYQTANSTNGQIIDKVLLASEQTILANNKLFINTLSRTDNFRSMFGTGTIFVDYMDYIVLNNQSDFSMINYNYVELFNKKDINLRYTSQLDDSFITAKSIGYPFVILVPKTTASSSSTVTLRLNNNSITIGNSFTSGTPIIKRVTGIPKNQLINSIDIGTNSSVDVNADIYLGYFEYGSKFESLPSKPF